MSLTRLAMLGPPTYMCILPMISRYGAMVASRAFSPPTMKKICPSTAWGCEPSMGVSMWSTPRPLERACTAVVASGLTVEQSQVIRPARAAEAMPPGPR